MKIKKPDNKVPFSTRLKPSVIEKLKDKAKADKVSVALVVETVIEKCLK